MCVAGTSSYVLVCYIYEIKNNCEIEDFEIRHLFATCDTSIFDRAYYGFYTSINNLMSVMRKTKPEAAEFKERVYIWNLYIYVVGV